MGDALFGKITRLTGRAIGDFDLIEHGDRVLVALSGGKDSWTLLYALLALQERAPVDYDIGAVTIEPDRDTFDTGALAGRLESDGVAHWIIPGNILDVVKENLSDGTNPCSFCARLRRGMLYGFAREHGWNKIALGHHLDDFVETLLMNLFFSGSVKGMSAKLLADDRVNTIIRPLVYVREDMTREYAHGRGLPIFGCGCPYQGMANSRRAWTKSLLARIEDEIPGVKSSILSAMGRVHTRHLLTAKQENGGKE